MLVSIMGSPVFEKKDQAIVKAMILVDKAVIARDLKAQEKKTEKFWGKKPFPPFF